MSELAWNDPCPHCDSELAYNVNGVTYSRKMGVEVRGVYDGVLYWQCNICGWAWHRWSPDVLRQRPLHLKAIPYVQDIQNTVLEAELLSE